MSDDNDNDERYDVKSKRQRRFRLKNVHSRKNKQVAPRQVIEKVKRKPHRPKIAWEDFNDDDSYDFYEAEFDNE